MIPLTHKSAASAGISILCTTLLSLVPGQAQALPTFARQTGQNCVSCHAGGQFPELTPYGRIFKMTGYTLGERTIPLSIMGVASYSNVSNTTKSEDPPADFQKNRSLIFATGSLFIAGKVTDNLGAFAQITYDNYASQSDDGTFHGHSGADNMDLRYADRFISGNQDLIFGVSLNNNPSIVDPWNTAAAWMQYVPVPSPTSYQFIDGNAPYPGFGSGGNIAGLNAYLFWNKTVYAEIGSYQTANRGLSFFSAGINKNERTNLRGINNPYWRLALSQEWGPHNIMVGTSGMIAHVYDTGSDTFDQNNLGRFRNIGVDTQYQYLLDPHSITVQLAYMNQRNTYSANTVAATSDYFLADGVTPVAAYNASDTTNTFRAKASYVYQAKYGGSFSFFKLTGTTNTLNQSAGYDDTATFTSSVTGNLSGNPGSRGLTYEAFWTPEQHVRVGLQYTAYNKYNGAHSNYNGLGRNASDNDTLFFYVWGAY